MGTSLIFPLHSQINKLSQALCSNFRWETKVKHFYYYISNGWMNEWMDGWLAGWMYRQVSSSRVILQCQNHNLAHFYKTVGWFFLVVVVNFCVQFFKVYFNFFLLLFFDKKYYKKISSLFKSKNLRLRDMMFKKKSKQQNFC